MLDIQKDVGINKANVIKRSASKRQNRIPDNGASLKARDKIKSIGIFSTLSTKIFKISNHQY